MQNNDVTQQPRFYPWGPKGMTVALFGAIGAYVVAMPSVALTYLAFPKALLPHFEGPAWLLLATVLWEARRLSQTGKVSASWAVLAYGSLCAALIKLLVTVVWYESDNLQNQWVTLAIFAGLGILVMTAGLKVAYRAQWTLMSSLGIFLVLEISVLGLMLNYAQHSYCHRHNLFPKRRVMPEVSPSPPAQVKQKSPAR